LGIRSAAVIVGRLRRRTARVILESGANPLTTAKAPINNVHCHQAEDGQEEAREREDVAIG
jgi:archaeosine-15-forming tRNA-guanine transglycosylase